MGEIVLERTCTACPEQYDAFLDGKQVGYLRLRHGCFTVDCPDVDGKQVYCAEPMGDGMFFDEEREKYLDAAKKAIMQWLAGRGLPKRGGRDANSSR